MVQTLLPSFELANNTWTTGGSAPSAEWYQAMQVSDDAVDFAIAADIGSVAFGLITFLDFSTVTDPLLSTGHVIRMRGAFRCTGIVCNWMCNLRLYSNFGDVPGSLFVNTTFGFGVPWATLSYNLSAGEADDIHNYNTIAFRISPNLVGTGNPRVTYLELEVPDGGNLVGTARPAGHAAGLLNANAELLGTAALVAVTNTQARALAELLGLAPGMLKPSAQSVSLVTLVGACRAFALPTGTAPEAFATLVGTSVPYAQTRGQVAALAALVGSAVGMCDPSGELVGGAVLQGRTVGASTAFGALSARALLAGRTQMSMSLDGHLVGVVDLIGSARGSTASNAFSSLVKILQGTARATGHSSASFTNLAALLGVAHPTASLRGTMTTITEADMGCWVLLGQAIRKRFETEVEIAGAVPVQNPNEGIPVQGPAQPWMRLDIVVTDHKQESLGLPFYRKTGEAVATLYVPVAEGEGRLLELADIIVASFRGVTADGVCYRVPSLRGFTREGRWWVGEVRCPFIYTDDSGVAP